MTRRQTQFANAGLVVYSLILSVGFGFWGWRLLEASLDAPAPVDEAGMVMLQQIWLPAIVFSVAVLGLGHAVLTVLIIRNLAQNRGDQFIMGASLWNLVVFPVGTFVGWKTFRLVRSQSPMALADELRSQERDDHVTTDSRHPDH